MHSGNAVDTNETRGWVVDGNYQGRLGDLVTARADTVVWLDYSRAVVMSRVGRRTLGRLVLRRELWNGNRESWSFGVKRDPAENILLWAWTRHRAYRRDYERASARAATEWVRLGSPRRTEQWLRSLAAGRSG